MGKFKEQRAKRSKKVNQLSVFPVHIILRLNVCSDFQLATIRCVGKAMKVWMWKCSFLLLCVLLHFLSIHSIVQTMKLAYYTVKPIICLDIYSISLSRFFQLNKTEENTFLCLHSIQSKEWRKNNNIKVIHKHFFSIFLCFLLSCVQ